MYTDLRKNRPTDIIINVEGYSVSSNGCPTIIHFFDNEETTYRFELEDGTAKIICEDTNELLLFAEMEELSNLCDWSDVVLWANKKGVKINTPDKGVYVV